MVKVNDVLTVACGRKQNDINATRRRIVLVYLNGKITSVFTSLVNTLVQFIVRFFLVVN